jgi:hypothetical protein
VYYEQVVYDWDEYKIEDTPHNFNFGVSILDPGLVLRIHQGTVILLRFFGIVQQVKMIFRPCVHAHRRLVTLASPGPPVYTGTVTTDSQQGGWYCLA